LGALLIINAEKKSKPFIMKLQPKSIAHQLKNAVDQKTQKISQLATLPPPLSPTLNHQHGNQKKEKQVYLMVMIPSLETQMMLKR